MNRSQYPYIYDDRAATIGSVVVWLATSPDADEHLGGIVYAQSEFKKRGLSGVESD